MCSSRASLFAILVVALVLVPVSAQQSGETYKLELHALSITGEKGLEFQIQGVALGAPTFPENAIFKLEIRRKTYKALWPVFEIQESEESAPVDSILMQLKKGSFIRVNPPLNCIRGAFRITAEFDPRHQQYKNVAAEMGTAFKQYRFSTDHLIGEMSDQIGKELADEAKVLTEDINNLMAFLQGVEKAALNGKELIDKQDQFLQEIAGMQYRTKQTSESSTYTIVPNLMATMMIDFQSYFGKALARVKGGLPPFETVTKQKETPKAPPGEKGTEEKGREKPVTEDEGTAQRTTYGGLMTMRGLQEDLDRMIDLVAREELLITLDLLAQAEDDFLKALLNNAKDLDIVIEHVESGIVSIERRHTEALKNEDEKNLRLEALGGKDREYLGFLAAFKELLKTKSGPKGEEERKKLVAELAKMSKSLREVIVKARTPDEVKHEDEKEPPKKK